MPSSVAAVSETHYELIRDAIFDNDRKRVTELLAAPGVDVDHFDAGGQTLLHLACFWGRMEMAKLLLAAGAMAEVIRLRGGSSVWEDKFGALQVELEDLTLRAQHLETQNSDKRRRLDTMAQELQSMQTQLAEEKSGRALAMELRERAQQQLRVQIDTSQRLEHERASLSEQLKLSRVAVANADKARERTLADMAALKAHRDDILGQMQASVKLQDQAALNWQRAEVAAAISDSQRNFAFAERDQFHRAQLATLAELLVTTERLGATEHELMMLKTDLAEHIFEMRREKRSQKHAAQAMASTRESNLTQGSRRSSTTPVEAMTLSEKKTRKPEEVQQLLQTAKATPKRTFSLAAREYGDRVRTEEQQKLRGRANRQQRVENQYRAHGFRAPVVDAEVFQEEFVTTVRAFCFVPQREMAQSQARKGPTGAFCSGHARSTDFNGPTASYSTVRS
ncbi:hypothetical protein PRIC1_005955 [Phytophthora ramorum]